MVPVSKLKRQIIQSSKEEGYIQDFEVVEDPPSAPSRCTSRTTTPHPRLRRRHTPGERQAQAQVYKGRRGDPPRPGAWAR